MQLPRFHPLRDLLIAAAIVTALGVAYWRLVPSVALIGESVVRAGKTATVTLGGRAKLFAFLPRSDAIT